MLFIITYATANADQRNEALLQVIQSYTEWAILSNSTYIVYTEDSIDDVMRRIKEVLPIEQYYRLFIGKIAPPLAWKGYADGFAEWVRRVFTAEYRPNTPETSNNANTTSSIQPT